MKNEALPEDTEESLTEEFSAELPPEMAKARAKRLLRKRDKALEQDAR